MFQKIPTGDGITLQDREIIDHAVAEFEPDDVTLHTVTGRMVVNDMPYSRAEGAEILIPVHVYEYYDHMKEKLAVHAGQRGGDREFGVYGSYSPDRSNNKRRTLEDGSEFNFRLEITNANVANAWMRHGGKWTRLAHIPDTEQTEIAEVDCMTEIQSDGGVPFDLPMCTIRTRITGCYTEEKGWTPPREVLRWSGIEGPTDSHDGEFAQLDWLIDQETGHFVFEHYI